ncbi:hypothetical protein RQ479_07760 [Mesorhizobium sp. ISC25]|uniref:hypothetical protein n=1 Tax=Mesorhizobium sp. ISC25 TaxID=3077335 RepID=UPI0035DFC380
MSGGDDRYDFITFGWIATIIGLLLFGSLLDSQKSIENQSSYYARKCAARYSDSPFSTTYVHPKSSNQKTEKANDSSETNTDWCDLAAQQSVAEDTTSMYRINLFGLIASGVGIFFIWRTLKANQFATKAAIQAANTATAAANAAIAAERPYVFLWMTKRDPFDGKKLLGINFKNFGRTPGFVTRIQYDVGLFAVPPDPETAGKQGTDRTLHKGAIAAYDVDFPNNWHVPLTVTTDMMEGERRKEGEIYLYGIIYYEDPFGTPHKSWFCRVYRSYEFVPAHLKDEHLNGFD